MLLPSFLTSTLGINHLLISQIIFRTCWYSLTLGCHYQLNFLSYDLDISFPIIKLLGEAGFLLYWCLNRLMHVLSPENLHMNLHSKKIHLNSMIYLNLSMNMFLS